jgi:hypothetical protein
MNYKVMQRPMFRLGGGVIKGKKVGNRENFQSPIFSESIRGKSLEELMEMQAASADKSLAGLDSMRDLVRLQTLGGLSSNVLPNIETNNPLRFISEFLSNPDTINLALKGLGGLKSVDAKAGQIKDKALGNLITGKIGVEKLAIERLKGSTTKTKMNYEATAEALAKTNLSEAQKSDILLGVISGGSYQTVQRRSSDLRKGLEKQIEQGIISRKQAEDIVNNFEKTQLSIFEERENNAEGGRVGYQQGTPNPNMLMPQPKPEEAMNDRRVNTLMEAAPAMEDPNEARSMGDQDMYKSLRRRLPPEITDDVVRLIAYNREAFTDFANISDQSDVQSFNQKYNVELVLPVGNQ